MATSTSRDAKLVLSVESLGQENITKLEKSLRDLAATGDASAAEFGDLADQISRLGAQNDALQSVKTLSADTQHLVEVQAQAAVSASTLAANLDVLKAATAQAKEQQAQARAELTQGEAAYKQTVGALRALKAEYDAAGKNTDAYRSQLQRLTAEQNQADLALVSLRESSRQATAAVREATAEQNKAQGAYSKAATALRNATQAADDNAKALEVAGRAAKQLGVNVEDLADAEASLISAFTQASNAADARKAALQEMAEADRLAAREAQTMAEMVKRGEAALWAEEAALRDAARSAREYEAAKAKAAADSVNWQKEADEIVALATAQQSATRSTQEMVERLRDLAASNAFEKQAEEARKMMQSAEYARFWADALDEADRKQQELAANTKRVNDAFAQINVRPIELVQREIDETNAAMQTLAASGKLTGGALAVAMASAQTKVNGLQREMRELTGTMTLADRAAGLLKNSMGQIAAGNIIADGIGYLINKIKELGLGFVTTISESEKLSRALNAVYKDANLAAQQMQFLRSTAVGAGVAVADLQPNFVKFVAATKSANISMQVTNELFAATTRAAGTLGLSGEQVGGMLEALAQMASKGTVSMEELRQQLGDRLPGALSLVAKGLGLTEAQLIKLVESGQLAARDLFPALTKSLKTMHGEVTGLNVTWQNFKNVLTGVAQDAGDAGWTEILTGALKVLGGTVATVALGLSTVWEGLRLTGVGSVALAATLRGEGTEAWGFFNEQVDVSINRLTKQNDRLTAMLDPASDAAKRMREIGAAQGGMSTNTDKSTASINKFTEQIASTSASTAVLAEITTVLSNSQMDLGARIVKINALTAERLELLDKEVVAADKQAKAVKIQGDALVTMTQLRNSEVETLQAQSTATENNLTAALKAAEAQRTVTAVLTEQRNALIALAEQEASGIAGREKEIQAIDKKLTQSRAELSQADATVAALREETAARQQAIAVLQDNSAKVAQFRQTAADAEAAVISYKAALESGTGSTAEYARLQQQAAIATGLYRDALSDLAERTQAQSQLDQANIAIKQAGLSVQKQAYEQLAAAARESGNLAQATYYEVEAKRVQIQITRAVAEAKMLEVQAARAAVQEERRQLETNGQLTEAKKLELDARLANIKAKEIEAGASTTVIKALEAEINAIQRGITARGRSSEAIRGETRAINSNTTERERSIAVREKELDLQEREDELRRRQLNIDKDGFTLNSSGDRMRASAPSEAYIKDVANTNGLSAAQTLALIDQYFRDGRATGFQANRSGETWFSQVARTASSMNTDNLRSKAAAETQPSTPQTQTTKTVNINLRGRTTPVTVASGTDADNLVGLLRQLENDGSTAA